MNYRSLLALISLALFLSGCAAASSGTLKSIETVEVCLNGECGPAGGRFSKEELVGGLLLMLKANENTQAVLCDTDPKTGECVRDDISFFVQGGPIPGVSTYSNAYLTQVGLDKKTFQIKYTMAATVTWIGTPVLCQDQYTEVTVSSVNDIFIESPSFACTWTAIPHGWNFQYSVGAIDFDNSVISGNYAIAGAGLLVGGGGEGTFLMKFPNKNTLAQASRGGLETAALKPVGQLPPQVLAAPVPRPDDVAVSTGAFDPDERALWETVSRQDRAEGLRRYLERYPEGRFAGPARAKLQVAEERQAQNRELALWNKIRDSAQAADFAAYIAQYPKGLYVELAAIKGRRLKAASVEAAALDAELALWNRIKDSTDAKEMRAYLERYPEGQFATVTRSRLEKLSQAASQVQGVELAQWNTIKDSREIRDYQNFLQAFPDGIFSGLAKGRLQGLAAMTAETEELAQWNRIKDSTEPADFDQYLNRYPTGRFAGLAKDLKRQLAGLAAGRAELALWESIKDSGDAGDFDDYLARFPAGRFAAAALDKKLAATPLDPSAIAGERRFALVIGNGDYRGAPGLANPPNDARLMAGTLRGLGFDVIERIDADREGMLKAVRDFGDKLEEAGESGGGLFFYAGHGVQVDGVNYMIPTSARIERQSDVKIYSISAGDVLGTMAYARNRLNFVIMDACRDNPYARSFRSLSRGLARMDAPRGTLIAYATAPGDVAADGEGANSPYTAALVRAMKTPGMTAEAMFKKARLMVMAATGENQVPWEASSLTGDFFFRPK